jgi:hypothetical protein
MQRKKQKPTKNDLSSGSGSAKRRRSAKKRSAVHSGEPITTPPRVISALSKMRAGASLRKASRESGVAARTVLKRAASVLRKNKSGRYSAKANDRLIRVLKIPTSQGPVEISVRGLRAASRLGRYWVAVDTYYENGDGSGLKEFEDESITAVDGTKYPFLTDLNLLNHLGYAGVLSFESLYGRSA